MKRITKPALTLTIAMLFLFNVNVDACTGIRLKTQDGKTVSGRTLEFGLEVKTSLVVVPKNYQFVGNTDNGDGLSYKTKYSMVGMMTFTETKLADGMNSAGLSAGAFFFPTMAEYTPLTKENQHKALSPIDFNNWILSQFATVDEVRTAVENNAVVVVPTILEDWGNIVPPFHYVVYDKAGNSIVIEPVGGELIVHDNPLGVMSNSPTFDWHMTNLRNYTNLKTENAPSMTIDGVTFEQFGQGSGMHGIPGDFSPPSRFVRAAAFSANYLPSETTFDAIKDVFHVLNNFDIPKGFSRETSNDGTIHSDYTQLTTARDPQTLKYYYKTFDDQSIKEFDLTKFDENSNKLLVLNTASEQSVINVNDDLKPVE
jgi:choloylglycine hydrolase